MESVWLDAATVVGAAIGAYVWLVLVLRISGKRSLSKLNAFDFAVTVAFGSALATIVISRDVGLVRGATALAMLALLQWAVSSLSLHWRWFGKLVRSTPVLLLEDGKPIGEALQRERLTHDELLQAVRKQGKGRLDEVAAVVLETDGSFSVIGRSDGPIEVLEGVRRLSEEERPSPRK